MNAHQPNTESGYGYDAAHPPFQRTGAPIFGYDASANWFTAFNSDPSAGNTGSFHQFTGKERDSESGLDYFGARYYGSALGRFSSPDEPLADQNERDPQSWNLYSYVRNNPLRNVDPDGRTCSHSTDAQGRDVITDTDGKGCAELHDNNVYAYDNPGIAMLAGLGANYSGSNMAQFVSDAARATAKVAAPEASAVAECIAPGGNCDTANLGLAMLPFGLSKLPKWAETAGGFVNYLKNFEGKIALTAEEADGRNCESEGTRY